MYNGTRSSSSKGLLQSRGHHYDELSDEVKKEEREREKSKQKRREKTELSVFIRLCGHKSKKETENAVT